MVCWGLAACWFAVTFAQAAQVSRRLPWRLRKPRKSRGVCRGVCASCASLAAFAVTFAQAAQVSRHLPWCLRKLRWVSRRLPWGLPYLCRPGFRPGLWSTGPTARPGTGERPVGAPDHSQGRNPWCVDDRGETPGGWTIGAKPLGGAGTRCGRIRAGRYIHSGPGARLVGRMQYAPTPLRSFAPMGRVSGLTPKHLNGAQPQQLNTYRTTTFSVSGPTLMM